MSSIETKLAPLHIALMEQALEAGLTQSEAIDLLHRKFEGATKADIERVREIYASGSDNDIEVDDNALTSRGDRGKWVMGWLWISDFPPDIGDEVLNPEEIVAVDQVTGENSTIAAGSIWSIKDVSEAPEGDITVSIVGQDGREKTAIITQDKFYDIYDPWKIKSETAD